MRSNYIHRPFKNRRNSEDRLDVAEAVVSANVTERCGCEKVIAQTMSFDCVFSDRIASAVPTRGAQTNGVDIQYRGNLRRVGGKRRKRRMGGREGREGGEGREGRKGREGRGGRREGTEGRDGRE